VDVALTYRNYLIEHKGLGQQAPVDSAPFYMTLGGGTVRRHSILGFPVNLQTAATSYSQAQTMVEALSDAGVRNAVITYNEFNTARIRRQISTSVQYSRMLGGRRGFERLSDTVDQSGFVMYPSLGFMEYHRSGRGFNFMRHSVREVTRSRVTLQNFELAFGTPDLLQETRTILSPAFFEGAFDSVIESLQREGIDTISLDRATSLLYSDFSTARARRSPDGETGFNRRDTVQILTDGFRRLNDEGISILAQSANAYALPYVSHISNVPLFSSGYDIFDFDIPFYQIVIRGLIPYTTNPFNASADLNRLTLLALSTGTPIHYEFIYESPADFTDSDYSRLFFAHFSSWVDDALEKYRLFDEIIGDIMNEQIVGHTRLSDNEIETEFEGGRTIRVNFDTNQLRVDGRLVDTGLSVRGVS